MAENGGIETSPDEQVDPPMLAETCMRELVGRASFGHIRSVLRPVLRHFDLHKLWVPNEFAIHTFRIIIFSIQVNIYCACNRLNNNFVFVCRHNTLIL